MKKLFILMFMTILLIGIINAANLTILSGTTSIGGNLTYDYVYVAAGATLQVDGTKYLNITATQYINISGAVNGVGLGQAGGAGATATAGDGSDGSISQSGGGHGGKGGSSSVGSGGSGGGSYAVGGNAGSGTAGNRYPGGIAYANGTDKLIYIGSGGGGGGAVDSVDGGKGGNGGAGISLKAPIIFINGTINMSGNNGNSAGSSGFGGGAGSGGTILLIGRSINISNTNFQVKGGSGGNDAGGDSTGSGGGGSGGVIKIFYVNNLYNTSITTNVLGGGAGDGTYLGTAGGNGTVYTSQETDLGFAPEVVLNSPIDGNISTIPTINFNCSASDDIKVQNVSLYINNLLNETNTSGINNVPYIFIKSLEYGFYNWTCGACNNATNPLCTNATVRNLTVFPVIINSNTFNSTTFETSSETFTINLTANSSLTAVSLNYNGTLYPMTNQGLGIWSKTLGITSAMVGTQSFNYKYTYGGNNYYSENQTQVVSPLVFVNCNSTYATKFINFTFKDENTLNILNGTIPYSEFVYYLGDGTINKTYTFTNTTTNISSFTFCSNAVNSTLKVNPTIQYVVTSYPQRIYQPSTLTLTNVTTNQSLYLLGVSDGIFVTYQVLTTSNQPIEGVDVVSTRTILGEEIVVGVGQTDASGIVTFWENPDFLHSTTFSKTGYDSYVFNHFPTRSEYTISLGEQVEIPESLTRGISFVILPKKTFLYENTINTFSLSLSSIYNDLEEFGFSLTYSNGTLIGSNISTSALGGIITLQNINISTTKNITMVSYYVIDGKTTLLNPTYWIIQTLDGTQYSIKNLFNEFDTYSSSDFWGFGDFERIILSILILILMVGGLSRRYGIANEATITSMIFGVVALLDVVLEFIPEITIPATGVTLPQGTLTAITFLILIVLLIMEER